MTLLDIIVCYILGILFLVVVFLFAYGLGKEQGIKYQKFLQKHPEYEN